jgi:hypothetical protein
METKKEGQKPLVDDSGADKHRHTMEDPTAGNIRGDVEQGSLEERVRICRF